MKSPFIYKENMGAPLFRFDGHPLFDSVGDIGNFNGVNPAIGYTEDSEQLVQSTRNANGEVVAHPIGRRLKKINNLSWPYLTAAQVQWLEQYIERFTVTLTYYDGYNGWISRRFYFGDFSAQPIEWEVNTTSHVGHGMKQPTMYKDVKVNLIDMGYQ